MTNQNEDSQSGEAEADNLSDAQFEETREDIRIEEAKPPRAPLRMAAVSLALVLSLVAVAGLAYVIFTPPEALVPPAMDTTAIDALERNVRATADSIQNLTQRLDELAGHMDSSADSIAESQQQLANQLERQLRRQMEAFESLPGRMSNIEDTMASIQGISTGIRDSWLLAEAEYYMQIANAQLQLAGNPQLARLALLQADDRIRQLANPALTNVRRALSDELRALQVVNQPDVEGITLTLASLADVVNSLPLRQQLDIPDAGTAAPDAELSGIDRAMASLKSTLSDVVSVRRTDEAIEPLIAPESAYFLRANLSLQLQVARLALLRGERAAFQQSLDDSDTWLGRYYDTDSNQVLSARQTIAEIRDSLFDISLPDISESLRLLRQFNALAQAPTELAAPAEASPVQ
jgi:uroporphyrin-3 C-methyltransferase